MKFRRAQENAALKKVLREEIDEAIQQEASNDEIIDQCRERMRTTTLTDVDITVMVSYIDCQFEFILLFYDNYCDLCFIVVEMHNGLGGVE